MQHDYNVYWDKLRHSIRYQPSNRFRSFLVKELLENNFDMDELHIADVGCGDGSLLQFISQIKPNACLTGFDISSEQMDFNAQLYPLMRFFHFDAGNSAVPGELKETFDLVLSCEVIEHIENDMQFIDNILYLLKPGGTLFLTTISGKLRRLDKEVLGHFRSYEKKEICSLLAEKGINADKSYNTGFPIFSLQKRLVNVFYDFVIKKVASGRKPSVLIRLTMSCMYFGMVLCRKIPLGPQLVVIGRKPSHF